MFKLSKFVTISLIPSWTKEILYTRNILSLQPVTRCLSSFIRVRPQTSDLWPTRVRKLCWVSRSQNLTNVSLLELTIMLWLSMNDSCVIIPLWPTNLQIPVWATTSHIIMCVSWRKIFIMKVLFVSITNNYNSNKNNSKENCLHWIFVVCTLL